jgi:5-methylcytosine-specific restriction endonuclease McrBC regulatory subunit McrC
MVADWTWRFNRITKQTTMTINSKFELQAAQRELSALMQHSVSINAARISEIQQAIHVYLSKIK